MSVGAKVVDSGVKYCVVCGQGSHRTDWIRKSGDFVACDKHTDQEMQSAINGQKQVQAEAQKTPAAPSAPAGQASKPATPATAFKKG